MNEGISFVTFQEVHTINNLAIHSIYLLRRPLSKNAMSAKGNNSLGNNEKEGTSAPEIVHSEHASSAIYIILQ